jgi:hypothetical protein
MQSTRLGHPTDQNPSVTVTLAVLVSFSFHVFLSSGAKDPTSIHFGACDTSATSGPIARHL